MVELRRRQKMSKIIGEEMYLPLAYVKRYNELCDLYCSNEFSDCEPEVLLEMIADENWGNEKYSGPNKNRYFYTFNRMNKNFFTMHSLSACFAVAGFVGLWKYNKVAYEPDYEFSKELMGTRKLRVYPEMIKHLPFNTFYLDFSKNKLFQYEGFFVQIKVYDTGAIRISSLPTEKNFSNIPLHKYEQEPSVYADSFWIKPELFNRENEIYYFDFDLHKDMFYTIDSFNTQWFAGGVSNYRMFLLQFLMYLSSKEPDIVESNDTIKTYRPSNYIRNKYSEIRKWDIGCRYGEKIRLFNNKRKAVEYSDYSRDEQKTKRPHIRKAHWERYHIGKGRSEIITKWKEPVFVNGDCNDIISNVHVVTNCEPTCSSGEELIKQYLKSKNIKFNWQHYIRDIKRRYDFSIEKNNKLIFIEFDGEQHFRPVNHWKGRKGYIERRKADIEKNEYCKYNEIPLLRIRYDQAYCIPNMIDDILLNETKYLNQINTYLSNDEYYSICE